MSSIKIFNLALDHLNEEPTLSVDDDRAPVRFLLRNYEIVRDALLRRNVWNFAVALAELPALATTPSFGWKYQYQKPSDAVRILPVTYNGLRNGQSIKYEIVGQTIQTDQPAPLKIRYIRKVDDDSEFDPLFVELMGVALALKMAHWLTGKQSYVERLTETMQRMMNEASLIDALEGTPESPEESDWITGRTTGTPY